MALKQGVLEVKKKLREYQYKEGYVRFFENKTVEWDEAGNVEQMSEQIKRAMVHDAIKLCSSLKGEKAKNVGWNNVLNATVERKEATWKEIVGARNKVTKERYLKIYKEEKRKVKRCICQRKNEVNEQIGI